MFRYRIKLDFDAAHFLPDYDGPCKNMHGHTWHIEFYVRVPEPLPSDGIGIDFKELKEKLESILPDHKLLNDDYPVPTAEVLVRELMLKANKALTFLSGMLTVSPVEKVVLWETEKNGIEVGN